MSCALLLSDITFSPCNLRRYLQRTVPDTHVWVDIIMLVAKNGDWRISKTLLEEDMVDDDVKEKLVEEILKAPKETDNAKEKLIEDFYDGPEGGPKFGRISEDEGQIPETVRGNNFYEAAKGARETNMIRRSNDAYDILGVEKGMDFEKTSAAAKKRYKILSVAYHPDKGGSDEVFQKINQAYHILTNEEKYSTYDPEENIFTYAKTSCGKCGGSNKRMISNAIASTMSKYCDDVKANTRSQTLIGVMPTEEHDIIMKITPLRQYELENAYRFRTSEDISLNSKIKVCENLTRMNNFDSGGSFVVGTDAAAEEEKTPETPKTQFEVDALLAQI